MVELFANSGDPDQTMHSAASDLGLRRLPVIHLGVSSLQWVMLYVKANTDQPTHLQSDSGLLCPCFH